MPPVPIYILSLDEQVRKTVAVIYMELPMSGSRSWSHRS